jgi:hypothetical protein
VRQFRIWDKHTPLLGLHLLWSRPSFPFVIRPFPHLYLYLHHYPKVDLFRLLLAFSSPLSLK